MSAVIPAIDRRRAYLLSLATPHIQELVARLQARVPVIDADSPADDQ
jgi:hypothetical protein